MAIVTESNASIAILIDADNAQATIINGLLSEVAKFGVASVKRIYGDWTTPNLGSWKSVLLEHSIQPMQQFRYTTGKNATDSAMIIDAMDLLYTNTFDGFCIVSSDSDFTRLASRIRESGKRVYGFGEKKTPQPFVDACSTFIYTENLVSTEGNKTDTPIQPQKKNRAELRQDTALVKLLRTAVEQTSEEDSWAHMSKVGHYISNNSSFSSINYGYKKLSDLIKATELFNIEMRKDGTAMYIRDARK